MNGFLPFNSIMTPSSAFFQEVDDADVQLLHETTGQPKDRCLAALLNVAANVSSEARLETAAAELMDEVDAQVRISTGIGRPSVWPFKVLYRVVKGGETSKISKEMFTRKYLGGKMIQFDYYIRCLFMGWFNHPARGGSVGFSLVLVVWCLFFLGGWDGSVVGDLEIGGRTARVLKRDVKSWVFTRAGLPKWAAWTSWRNRFLDAVLWMGRCK